LLVYKIYLSRQKKKKKKKKKKTQAPMLGATSTGMVLTVTEIVVCRDCEVINNVFHVSYTFLQFNTYAKSGVPIPMGHGLCSYALNVHYTYDIISA
jgi:hypothetical protein